MLRLIRSPDLAALADALGDVLRTPAGGPLDAEWVVVGARPTERWLTARLAQRLGVCAHVRFLSPSSLLEETIAATLGTSSDDTRAWSAGRLTWRVLAALPAILARPELAPVRGYLQGESGTTSGGSGGEHDGARSGAFDAGSARAVAFARRVAECFARYAVVMPDEVMAWDAPRAGDDWQRVLWRALRDDPECGEPLPALAGRALDALRRDGAPASFPKRIAWVAQPGVAPLHARAVAELARAGVEIVALAPTPSVMEWWRDAGAAQGAPALLRSLGRLAADTAWLIGEAARDARVGVDRLDLFAHDAPRTALELLRADVTDGVRRGGGAPRVPLDPSDDSLRVHACHGPMRQAEVLRDELLRLFSADETLAPRDVLVLTPDPATFAPLVEAAFGAAGGAASIPVRVVDRPSRRGNAAADVALRILELASGRVDAVQALDVLAVPCVAARFGLGQDAEETLRRWVRESGVRWGLDADDRAESHALPRDEEHTWRFGLERLLLGWGMPGAGRVTFGGAMPYDEVEGSDAELLGRFAEACTRLFDAVRAARGARTLDEWRRVVIAAVDALVDESTSLTVPRRELRGALDALVDEAGTFDAPVSLAAVRTLLSARFAEPAVVGGETGAVTLASLRPGRVTPARVIALLGVDEAAFPRPRSSAGFDLLAREPRAGAVDPPSEDRMRVLEALHSARERLLVVYAGRSVDTNEPIAPAVPIAELLDAVDATFERADGAKDSHDHLLPARTLVEHAHPLQPFSPEAFAEPAPRSHDAVYLAGARRMRGARTAAPAFLTRPLPDGEPARAVTVDELARWLAEPAKTFVTRRLGVWYDAPDVLDVADPLDLDALGEYQLRREVVDRLLAGEDLADARELLRAAGALPHGPLGHIAFDGAVAEARAVARPAQLVRRVRTSDGVHVDAAVGGVRLVGRLGPLWHGGVPTWNAGLREVHAGTARARHLARLWVRHLALHLAPETRDAPPTSVLVARPDKQGNNASVFGPVADAVHRLGDLVALYVEASRAPLPYVTDASHAYAEQFGGERTDEDAHRAGVEHARRAWSPSGEFGPDAYSVRLFGERGPIDDPAFGAVARRIWSPLLGALQARAE